MSSPIDQNEALEWVLGKIAGEKTVRSRINYAKKPAGSVKFAPKKMNVIVPFEPPSGHLPKGSKLTKEELESTKKSELELWKKWKTGGMRPEDLDPLLHSMKRLIENRSRIYKNKVEIPTAAIDMEHKQQVYNALKSYDPKKGSLGTWVGVYLKKGDRYVKANQNFARIPETLANQIGLYQKVKDDLTEELGHEPSTALLAEHTGISTKDIKRLNKEVRKGYISTGLNTDIMNTTNFSDREREVIRLIYPRLTEDEKKVHELTFGLFGKPALSPGQIAKKLKMDSSKVAKLRTSVFNKMKPYLPE